MKRMNMSQKPLALLLSVLMALSAFAAVGVTAPLRVTARSAVLPGDVNWDGAVDGEDLALLRACMAADQADVKQLVAGDLDGDGALTAVDFMRLRRLIMQQEM